MVVNSFSDVFRQGRYVGVGSVIHNKVEGTNYMVESAPIPTFNGGAADGVCVIELKAGFRYAVVLPRGNRYHTQDFQIKPTDANIYTNFTNAVAFIDARSANANYPQRELHLDAANAFYPAFHPTASGTNGAIFDFTDLSDFTFSGSPGKSIIRGLAVHAGQPAGNKILFYFRRSPGISFQGLTIEGSYQIPDLQIPSSGPAANTEYNLQEAIRLVYDAGQDNGNFSARECVFRNLYRIGINWQGEGDYLKVIDCRFENIIFNSDVDINQQTVGVFVNRGLRRIDISGCTFQNIYDNGASGLSHGVYIQSTPRSENVIVANNFFLVDEWKDAGETVPQHGAENGSGGIKVEDTDNAIISGNVTQNCTNLFQGSSNVVVSNNTMRNGRVYLSGQGTGEILFKGNNLLVDKATSGYGNVGFIRTTSTANNVSIVTNKFLVENDLLTGSFDFAITLLDNARNWKIIGNEFDGWPGILKGGPNDETGEAEGLVFSDNQIFFRAQGQYILDARRVVNSFFTNNRIYNHKGSALTVFRLESSSQDAYVDGNTFDLNQVLTGDVVTAPNLGVRTPSLNVVEKMKMGSALGVVTDADGEYQFAHGAEFTPNWAMVVLIGDNVWNIKVVSVDANNLTVLVKNEAGLDVVSQTISFYWQVSAI